METWAWKYTKHVRLFHNRHSHALVVSRAKLKWTYLQYLGERLHVYIRLKPLKQRGHVCQGKPPFSKPLRSAEALTEEQIQPTLQTAFLLFLTGFVAPEKNKNRINPLASLHWSLQKAVLTTRSQLKNPNQHIGAGQMGRGWIKKFCRASSVFFQALWRRTNLRNTPCSRLLSYMTWELERSLMTRTFDKEIWDTPSPHKIFTLKVTRSPFPSILAWLFLWREQYTCTFPWLVALSFCLTENPHGC